MNFIEFNNSNKLRQQIEKNINTVLNHHQYILGPEVFELEKKLSNFVGVNNCIAVSSGTDALLISLMALGIKPGDEIITTPFSFISTAEVIINLGAKPVFVDVNYNNALIDPNLIEKKITKKTKAIIFVSLFGNMDGIDEINLIAKNNCNIPVIEDGAQSFGSKFSNRNSCSITTIGCTSFYPSKPLGCYGDGGAIFTNSNKISELMKQIRIHGQNKKYNHKYIGVGGRIDTIQCAILLAKYKFFKFEIKQRKKIASIYDNFFKNISDKKFINKLEISQKCHSIYSQYTIRIKNRRHALIKHLLKDKIPTAIHYPKPINSQKAYKAFNLDDTPIAKKLSKEVLSLPMSPYLKYKNQMHIINSINKFINNK